MRSESCGRNDRTARDQPATGCSRQPGNAGRPRHRAVRSGCGTRAITRGRARDRAVCCSSTVPSLGGRRSGAAETRARRSPARYDAVTQRCGGREHPVVGDEPTSGRGKRAAAWLRVGNGIDGADSTAMARCNRSRVVIAFRSRSRSSHVWKRVAYTPVLGRRRAQENNWNAVGNGSGSGSGPTTRPVNGYGAMARATSCSPAHPALAARCVGSRAAQARRRGDSADASGSRSDPETPASAALSRSALRRPSALVGCGQRPRRPR